MPHDLNRDKKRKRTEVRFNLFSLHNRGLLLHQVVTRNKEQVFYDNRRQLRNRSAETLP